MQLLSHFPVIKVTISHAFFRGIYCRTLPERLQLGRKRRDCQQRHLRRPQLGGLLQARDQPKPTGKSGLRMSICHDLHILKKVNFFSHFVVSFTRNSVISWQSYKRDLVFKKGLAPGMAITIRMQSYKKFCLKTYKSVLYSFTVQYFNLG